MPPTVNLEEALAAARIEATRILERAGLRVRSIAVAAVLEDPRAPSMFYPAYVMTDEGRRRRQPRDAALLANILGEAAADACPPPPAVLRDVIG